ncbi:MAG TPA: hypothetical protein IAB49_01110 [Candidatus Caccenecus avistercoris]|nr:hypothetical protein [Candidatus Caccenecus avistercoris]
MKRLFIAFLITLVLGVGIYFITTLIGNKEETTPVIKEGITYEFDDSYSENVTIDALSENINNEEEVIILIGKKEEDPTKKVSAILGELEMQDTNIYYLERQDNISESLSYQNLLASYPELNNYMNFTPVILVFRNREFIGGLPGEVEKKNITQFLEYTEVI